MIFSTSVAWGAVVNHQEYTHSLEEEESRAWQPPTYQTTELFAVPEKLKENWQFWVDIYSQHTTHQGVIHDSLYPHLVYEKIDFSNIEQNPELTAQERATKKREFVKNRKEHIKKLILSLSKESQQKDEWSPKKKRLWTLFERIEEKQKYKKAATDQRMRFQLGQKDRFLRGIFYSGRYLEEMEDIFKKADLPLQLTRLPFVESSFNLAARSKVGASGIWQLMPRTGRQYMIVNPFIDERNDPIAATQAAAKILKHNFNKLQDWSLAVTAYNFGLYGVRRLLKRRGTSDLFEIIDSKKRSRRFGFASANFYLSFLAAVYVEQNANKYFKEENNKVPLWAHKLKYDSIRIQQPVSFNYLLSFFEGNRQLALLYNPHLARSIRKGYQNIPQGTKLYLQQGTTQKFVQNIPQQVPPEPTIYKVARGDTFSEIAKKFKIPFRHLIKANKISNPNRLRAGQVLLIPDVE